MQAGMNGACVTGNCKKESQIERVLRDAHKQKDELSAAINSLESKLSMICRQTDPAINGICKESEALVPLAIEIKQLSDSFMYARQRIITLIDLIEI
jgi:hypothetical protein